MYHAALMEEAADVFVSCSSGSVEESTAYSMGCGSASLRHTRAQSVIAISSKRSDCTMCNMHCGWSAHVSRLLFICAEEVFVSYIEITINEICVMVLKWC